MAEGSKTADIRTPGRKLLIAIGSPLLFAALAAIMYLTRNFDWGGLARRADPPPGTA